MKKLTDEVWRTSRIEVDKQFRKEFPAKKHIFAWNKTRVRIYILLALIWHSMYDEMNYPFID